MGKPRADTSSAEWLRRHATTIVVAVIGAVIAGLILYLLTGERGNSSSQRVVISPGAADYTTVESSDRASSPSKFSKAVGERPFWTSPPLLTKREPEGEELRLPFDSFNKDIEITTSQRLVEDPYGYDGQNLFLVGKVVERGQVANELIFEEVRLETETPFNDLYVALGPSGGPPLGFAALIVGRLAAVGYTQDPKGHRHRSAYIDARKGLVEPIYGPEGIGSDAIRTAYAAVMSRL